MYALFTLVNDYDQPSCCSMVWINKPSVEELYNIMKCEFAYISRNKIKKLLEGSIVYGTLSNKPEPWGYTSFSLRAIKEGEWLR